MFDVEDKNIGKGNGYSKKKKRKHHPTSKLNLAHEESKKLKLIDNGEYNKKHSVQCNIETSHNKVNKNLVEDMHGKKLIGSNNDPPKKKKTQKEKRNQSLDVITTGFIKSKIPLDDLKIVLDDRGPGISLKKGKYNTSHVEEACSIAVDENILNLEQNDDYLYKNKKKKKENINCALNRSITEDDMKSEVYDDSVKKTKKKKSKEVALAQEEVCIEHKKIKKRKHSAGETVGTYLSLADLQDEEQTENDCFDLPPKKSKKRKHKAKVSKVNIYDSLPIKLKKKKHKACEHENGSRFEKNKKNKNKIHLHSMEDKVNDTNNSMMNNLINKDMSVRNSLMSIKQPIISSSEGNTSKHRNESRDDTAMSESVSDDTFTLEVHEINSHNIPLNDVTEERPHSSKQYYTENNDEDVLDTTINHSNENRNCVKSKTNLQPTVEDILIKTEPLNEEHLSYKKLLQQVKDKSQPKEHCNYTAMHITVPWPVPPLHLIETRVCGRPTKDQKTKMDALGQKIKLGIYNRSEDDQIKRNWKEFCQVHDIPNEDPTPFLNFVQADGVFILSTMERINFVRFLAHGLYNRPLFSVYKRFRRLFLAKKILTGRFSPEEDRIIRKYMECTSRRTPYSDLAKILNRDRLAVEKRCKTLECRDENRDNSIKWEKENIEQYLKYILKVTDSDSLNDLKDREIKPQEWKMLSDKLDISITELRKAWSCTIYPKLFIDSEISSDAVKVALIEKLIENNANDWRAIDWEQMSKDFDGFTGRKLNKFLKDVVYYHVPQDLHKNLGECLQYLKKLVSEKKTFSRRTLKTFKLDESFSIT